MSTDEQVQVQDTQPNVNEDTQMQDASEPPTGPAAMAPKNKKRPRIDLAVESRERKRGKTMFGLVLGTLNKAKNEDKERNASEAAKKRHLIEQRLQDKLRKETDSVRRAEEAKKDKTTANRKEEELQLKDSIHKLRRTRLPLLANFLLTSDQIPVDDDTPPPPSTNPLAPMPRTHPPPLYYLPAILTPAQETFIQRRQAEVKEATEKEWVAFREERTAGVEEITQLRQRVAEEDARKKLERGVEPEAGERPGAPTAAADKDAVMATEDSTGGDVSSSTANRPETQDAPRPEREAGMEVDKDEAVPATAAPSAVETAKEVVQVQVQQQEHKEEPAPMHADDDDAVEY